MKGITIGETIEQYAQGTLEMYIYLANMQNTGNNRDVEPFLMSYDLSVQCFILRKALELPEESQNSLETNSYMINESVKLFQEKLQYYKITVD